MKPNSIISSLVIIVSFLLAMNAWAQTYPEGMVAYWKFNEGSGTVAYSSVGQHPGTISGPDWTAGQVGGALYFEGVPGDDYVVVPHHADLNVMGNEISIEAWVNFMGEVGAWDHEIISKVTGFLVYGYQFRLINGVLAMAIANGVNYTTAGYLMAGFQMPYGWRHVAAVYCDAQDLARLYLDGVMVVENPSFTTVLNNSGNTSDLFIGKWGPDQGQLWKGIIDELAIYNRILLPEEIAQHYQNGLNGQGYEIQNLAVILATNSIWLKSGAEVLSGDVIVNDQSSGPMLDSGVELSVGQNVDIAAGYEVKAHRIKVKQNAIIDSDVFYNELDNNGTVNGSENTPLDLPVFTDLPEFVSAPAGAQNIIVNKNQTLTLAAGDYGDIVIKQKGTIIFSGGIYNLRSLDAGQQSDLLFAAASEVRIEEKFAADQGSYLGPQDDSGIEACDIIFYVNGINGNNGNLGANPKAAKIGLNCTAAANFYVPNGTMWIRQNTTAAGAFLARDIIVGENVELTLNSFWGSGITQNMARLDNTLSPQENLLTTSAPEDYMLKQNYPNPFNPITVIEYALPQPEQVEIVIYNTLGQKIKTLVSQRQEAGYYQATWDATNNAGYKVSSGIYFYLFKAGEYRVVKKMVLLE